MSDHLKIQDTHRLRYANIYIRQSSATQVLLNREWTERQSQWSERTTLLGWSKTQIQMIDEDLARTGSGLVTRHGFVHRTHVLWRRSPNLGARCSIVASASDLLRLRQRVDYLLQRTQDSPATDPISPTLEIQHAITTTGAVERGTSSPSTHLSSADASATQPSRQPSGPTHSQAGPSGSAPSASTLHTDSPS